MWDIFDSSAQTAAKRFVCAHLRCGSTKRTQIHIQMHTHNCLYMHSCVHVCSKFICLRYKFHLIVCGRRLPVFSRSFCFFRLHIHTHTITPAWLCSLHMLLLHYAVVHCIQLMLYAVFSLAWLDFSMQMLNSIFEVYFSLNFLLSTLFCAIYNNTKTKTKHSSSG